MSKNERFEIVYKTGKFNIMDVIVDKKTGVNYLFVQYGDGGGLTPLLDKYGKVVVTDVATIK